MKKDSEKFADEIIDVINLAQQKNINLIAAKTEYYAMKHVKGIKTFCGNSKRSIRFQKVWLFMQELAALKLIYEKLVITREKTMKDTLHLNTIEVSAKYRGLGYGTLIMKAITELADEYQLNIILSPVPIDKEGNEEYKTAQNKLIAFYKKFGFIVKKGIYNDKQMIRKFK